MAKVTIGTGQRGGLLVRDTITGKVTEVFQDRPGQPRDPGRRRFIRRGGGGSVSTPGAEERARKQAVEKARAKLKASQFKDKRAAEALKRALAAQQKAFFEKQKAAKKAKILKQAAGIKKFEKLKKLPSPKIGPPSRRPPTPSRKRKVMTGTVTKVPVPKGFISRKIKELEDLQKRKSTASIRQRQKNIKNELALLGVTGVVIAVQAGVAFVKLPKTLFDLVRNPSQIKKIPSAISRGGKNFGQLIRVSPTEAFVKIVGEIFILQGTGLALRITGKLGSQATARLSGKFKGVKKDVISIPSSTGVKKTIKIKVSPKIGRAPPKKQAAFAGKRATVVSAQGDRLISLLKTKKVIRKPIRGEEDLSRKTKALLKKFDQGRVSLKELAELDRRIGREAKKGLLERSLFADPTGTLRKRFLRIQQTKDAGLRDILLGEELSFKTPKPQILIFEDVKIQDFPKGFETIKKKLSQGKPLTKSETTKFLQFQTKISGKFKPFGFQSGELEVTLAPGEIIKKVKTVAKTSIDGKIVPIIKAKVVKAKPTTKKLLKKLDSGKITKGELRILQKKLKRETGFRHSLSSGRGKVGKRISLKRVVSSLGSRVRTRVRRKPRRIPGRPPKRVPTRPPKGPPKGPPKRPPHGPPRRPPKRPPRRPPTRPPKGPPKRPPHGPPRRPPKRPPKRPPATILRPPRKQSPKGKKGKLVESFNVFGKDKGKFIKLNRKPLSKKDALDRGSFAIDKSTSRTLRLKPVGRIKPKSLGKLGKSERGHFKKFGMKFRQNVIRRKKAIKKTNQFIEKRKHAIDSRGEKRQLSLARLVKNKGWVKRRAPRKTKKKKGKRR